MQNQLRSFPTAFARVVAGDWPRSALGALLAIALTGAITAFFVGGSPLLPMLVAPIGASAVLLFAVPASPLAQPWPILAGNFVSALVGVTVTLAVGPPLLAAAVAVAAAIAAMSLLRCLHPPGGAVALTIALGGASMAELGYLAAVTPVLLNSALLAMIAACYNRATGHSYPHRAHPPAHPHPLRRAIVLDDEDFDTVLADYGDALDITREDLEELYRELIGRAEARRAGRKIKRSVASARMRRARGCAHCGARHRQGAPTSTGAAASGRAAMQEPAEAG